MYKIDFKKILLLLFALISVGIDAQIPAGYYYIADGKKKNELKSYLSAIVSQAQMLNYGSGLGATWQGFYYTDRNFDNSVVDMYSPIVRIFPENFGSIDGMHIEHSLPKSWWGTRQNNAYKDLFHLYPADGSTNSSKNNLPLGEVYSATFNNGVSKIGLNGFSYYLGRVFEPSDEFKGDFARSYLYMSVAYENFGALGYWNSPMINNNTYPVWQKWAVDLLLKWHRQDPVSEKERTRQEQVFQIQGNRNPFIDYPNLAEYIWGTDTNNVYHFPVETQPFMVLPNRWTKVDFGVIMQGNNESKSLQIWGRNISGNVNLSIKNSSPELKLSTIQMPNGQNSIQLSASQVNNSTNIFVDIIAQNTGSVADTLVISGGGLANAVYVPINAVVSSEFMALKAEETTSTTASLSWMKDNGANSYTVRVFKSTLKSSNLFFSGYIEGLGYNKALVIFNNTGRNIDLSKYSIKKQTNGAGGFKNEYALSGFLADGQKYVIVYNNNSAVETLKSLANQLVYTATPQDNPVNFNGNDAVGLYHNGVLIDIVGIENEVNMWGENLTLQRKSNIIHPTTEFSFDEWNILPTDDFAPAISHSAATFSDVLFNEYSSGLYNYTTIQNLSPQTQYIYEVRANKTGGNVMSVNRVAFRTKPLETPFALEATDIAETSFTANWEEVEGAQSYILDVYHIETGAEQSETEGFDGMVNSNYPNGWSGNTNSYYTGIANSGQSVPSVSFTANARWLQTKTYPEPVTELSFMYRFGTANENSKLMIWGNKGGEEWFEIDTIYQANANKIIANYIFNNEKNFKSFKFVLEKNGSNLAIDDVSVKYFPSDTVYIVNNEMVNNTNYWVNNLILGKTYFYRVKSYYQTLMSDFSNEISVKTQIPPCLFNFTLNLSADDLPYTWHNTILEQDTVFEVGTVSGNYIFHRSSADACDTVVHLELTINTSSLKEIDDNQIIIYSTKDGIYINGVKNGDKITIYTAVGIVLQQTTASSDQIFLPLPQNGIFIITINEKVKKVGK